MGLFTRFISTLIFPTLELLAQSSMETETKTREYLHRTGKLCADSPSQDFSARQAWYRTNLWFYHIWNCDWSFWGQVTCHQTQKKTLNSVGKSRRRCNVIYMLWIYHSLIKTCNVTMYLREEGFISQLELFFNMECIYFTWMMCLKLLWIIINLLKYILFVCFLTSKSCSVDLYF